MSLTNSSFSSFNELAKNHLESVNEEQDDKDVTNNTTTEFGTLADLTSHHLQKINFNTRRNFNKLAGQTTVDKLSDRISSVSLLTSTKSASAIEDKNLQNSIDSNWHIDLTKALRVSNSAPQIRHKRTDSTNPLDVENFVPQFIDCDAELENSSVVSEFCNMDISWILSTENNNTKIASKFGKVLCRRYKRPKPYFVNVTKDNALKDISPFSFNTPSPDDIISSHLGHK